MSNLESAYRSLDNAKREEQELSEKRKRYDEIYDILKAFCEDYTRYRTIPQAIEKTKEERNRAIFNILLALALYVGVFSVIDFIAVVGFGNTGMITSSIGAGIGSFSVCTNKFFSNVFKNNKKLKALRKLEEEIGFAPKYSNKSLQTTLELFAKDREQLKTEYYAKSDAIKEYEAALNEANKALAEEVLAESGIEASVTMNSSMKVLAKRYEPDKK